MVLCENTESKGDNQYSNLFDRQHLCESSHSIRFDTILCRPYNHCVIHCFVSESSQTSYHANIDIDKNLGPE